MRYRPEIDGLRAIAVLPVIFFHAGIGLFGGGFVGVDIFFVISGYLITSLLIEELERGEFKLLHFYERRARRLLPALFFVLLCSLVLAVILLLPRQLQEFSLSLIATIFFVSNIYFWRESDYFDASSTSEPLLHTWSLAVEEQYYLLFPLFLLVTWRFGKTKTYRILVGFAIISFIISEWGWRNSALANFYLAPTRAWEILAGAIAAFVLSKKALRGNSYLSSIGLISIAYAIFFFNENTPTPSYYSLLPVGGAVLIILFTTADTYTSRLLSHRFFVAIGLVSYSAYLWHQPVFAFANVLTFNQLSLIEVYFTITHRCTFFFYMEIY